MSVAIQNGWWASTLWSRVHWRTLALIVVPTLAADIGVYWWAYPRPAVIGLLGDLYNFGAGIWLARDLLFKDRESERKKMLAQLQSDIAGRGLPLMIEGILIGEPDALEKVFNRRKAGDALSACLMLGLGLVLVLVARLFELVEQGKVEILWRTIGSISF